jgi:hypothetical protein
MPVRIVFDAETQPRVLRFGSQASAMIYPGNNWFMNAIACFRMRIVALLSYVQ